MSVKRIISILAALLMVVCSTVCIAAVEPPSANLEIIDVSVWNDVTNWESVSKDVDGVIARIGYRGSQYHDKIAMDNKFTSFMQGILQNNISYGVYFYSYAYNTTEAIEEANWVINTLKTYNYKPDLPVYIDVETTEAQTTLTNRERTDIVLAFCETMKDNGYYGGVYANKYWLSELLYSAELADYPVWVAQYNTTCTFNGKYGMWQYTSSGTVNGITGSVDMSHCYYDYSTFIKKYGYNGYTGSETPTESKIDYSTQGTYKLNSDLDVRTGAADTYSSYGTLSKGSEVFVEYSKDGWGMVTYSNTTGYIKLGSAVTKTSKYITTKSGIGHYHITADVLNVRKGPSTSYDKFTELYSGEIVYISGIQDGWGYYYGNGTKCWISLDYAKFYGTVCFETNIADKYIQPLKIVTGKSSALTKWDITVTGKKFSGWATTSGGAIAYDDGATLTMGKANVVLYATFNQSKYFTFKTTPRQSADNIAVISDQGMTESNFVKKYITLSSGYSYKMKLSQGTYVGTGSVLTFTLNGNTAGTLTIVVAGDCSGDGVCNGIDLADALNISQGSNSTVKYSDAQKKAADVNLDGKVDSTDINMIKKAAFGTADLPQ